MPFKREILSEEQPATVHGSKEPAQSNTSNIKSITLPKKTEVIEITPRNISSKRSSYNDMKSTFIDAKKTANSRFQLNELSKKVMSIEEEELERIESEVTRRLAAKVEAIQEQARKSGYNAGFEEGKKDALSQTINDLKPVTDRINALKDGFEGAMREIATANEQIILRIINQILRKILLKEVAEDKEFIKRHVAAIIDRLGTRENIKIFISPQSFKDLETIRADLLSSISGLKNITIDVDANLTSYGCRVETEYGDVDATIDAQLQNISALLNISEAQ